MPSPIELIEFREFRKGSLLGFATVRVGRSMQVHDITVHQSNGRCWANPPGKPQINRDGSAMRGDDGKTLYVPVISFGSREGRDEFSAAVMSAVLAARPKLLEARPPGEEGANDTGSSARASTSDQASGPAARGQGWGRSQRSGAGYWR